MTAIRWALFALEITIGVVFTGTGMFAGVWAATESERSGPRSNRRWDATVVAYTAGYPTAATLLIGWLGPQPHGSFWLTALTGIACAYVGCLLVAFGLAKEEERIVALIGVALPAFATATVYNFSWLFPSVRFPQISLF